MSYDVGVRKMLLTSTTAIIQRQINPIYNPRTSHMRVQEVVRSKELRSLDTKLADVTQFDKQAKLERAVVTVKFGEARDEEKLAGDLCWISKAYQNYKLLNMGMLYLMGVLRSGCKGKGGFVGGNMSQLLKSCLMLRNTEFEVVILMCLEMAEVNVGVEELLNNHEPMRKNIAIGVARIDDDKVKDLSLIAHGIDFMNNNYRRRME
jgi:hypothetical protein